MKNLQSNMTLALALVCGLVGSASAQTIVRGPIVNLANKSRYYVVQGATWSAIRDFGLAMGGDMATIEDAAENAWVNTNMAVPVGNKVWIGLNDATTEGTYAWSDGSTSAYRNWQPGEPGNSATNDYTQLINGLGTWALRSASYTEMGVIEVKGAVRVPQEVPTFEAALPLAQQSSGEVIFAPGVYNITGSTNLNAPLTLRGAGRGLTVLNSSVNLETIVTSADLTIENVSLVVRGTLEFVEVDSGVTTIRDCDVSSILDQDGEECFEVWDSSLVLERTRVRNAKCLAYTVRSSASVRAVNCVIDNLTSLFDPFSINSHLTTTNCVINDISAAAALAGAHETKLFNTIVVNTPGSFPVGTQYSHCILPAAAAGDGNIVSTNPGFVNAAAGDFSLLPTSPAIDTGAIAPFLSAGASDLIDLMGQPRVHDAPGVNNASTNSNPIDIGPMEFQGGQGCDDIDFNNDGLFPDTEDIAAFIRVFGGGPCE